MALQTISGNVASVLGVARASQVLKIIPVLRLGTDGTDLIFGDDFTLTADGSGDITFTVEPGSYIVQAQMSAGVFRVSMSVGDAGPYDFGDVISAVPPEVTASLVQQAIDAAALAATYVDLATGRTIVRHSGGNSTPITLPVTAANVDVFIDGILADPALYTHSGVTVTPAAPWPTGTENIIVMARSAVDAVDLDFDTIPTGSVGSPSLAHTGDPDTGRYSPGANALAWATGGTKRLHLTSTEFTVDVPVEGTAVTQSATDTTAGRLLKVGDAGWLDQSPSTTLVNSAVEPGTYSYAGSGTDASAPSAAGGSLLVQRHGTLYITQLAMQANNWLKFTRYSQDNGTSWSAWATDYNEQNILGTVSQSAGVPTGAVVEQGSNSNGEYVRFADGTQICWHSTSVTQAISIGLLGGFRDAGQTWNFPIAFISAPVVSGNPQALTSFSVTIPTTTTTASSVFHTAIASQSSATLEADLIAIGRWF